MQIVYGGYMTVRYELKSEVNEFLCLRNKSRHYGVEQNIVWLVSNIILGREVSDLSGKFQKCFVNKFES